MVRRHEWRNAIDEAVTLHAMFLILKRGGHKETRLLDGGAQPRRTNYMPVKALARTLLESGCWGRATSCYGYFTPPAPDVVEAARGGGTCNRLMREVPVDWERQ